MDKYRQTRNQKAAPTRYAFPTSELRVGDIVGLSSNGTMSRAIRFQTGGGPLSHVALYLGNNIFAEAVAPRSRLSSLADLLGTERPISITVLRLRSTSATPLIGPRVAERMRYESRFYALSLYSLVKAAAIRLRDVAYLASLDTLICSEFVCRVYESAGIPLVPNNQLTTVTPNDLLRNDLLEDVSCQCPAFMAFVENWDGSAGKPRSLATIASIMSWCAAFWRALSPSRLAWATPHREWTHLNHFGFAAAGCLQIVKSALSTMSIRASTNFYLRAAKPASLASKDIEAERAFQRQLDATIECERENIRIGSHSVEQLSRTSYMWPWYSVIARIEKRNLAMSKARHSALLRLRSASLRYHGFELKQWSRQSSVTGADKS